MRWLAWSLLLFPLAGCAEDTYFIPGTGSLPECDDAPVANLDGTVWFDQGTVTIRTAGCSDAMPDDQFSSCALNWAFTQDGNEIDILVDEEYRIEGRLCDDELYLRGGWWLPVADEVEGCTYEDDSAEEVGIQADGNVLIVSPDDLQPDSLQLTGTLSVQGPCAGEYAVVFQPIRNPAP